MFAFPIFQFLDYKVIRHFDEPRTIINSYEMYKTHNFLVTTYNDEPDVWNTKPPLLNWLQVLSMKIFGPDVLAARIPSALSALVLCIFFYFMGVKLFDKQLIGTIASSWLIGINGFLDDHAARTAEYDALLCLFGFSSVFLFYYYFEKQKNKHLLYSAFLFSLGWITKSTAIVLFLPFYISIFFIFFKKINIREIVKLVLYFLLALIPVAVFYLLREIYNPGYLKEVWFQEYGGRFLETNEGNKGYFWMYFNELYNEKLRPFRVILGLSILSSLILGNKLIKKLSLAIILGILGFLFLISASSTRLPWYSLPSIPFFALLVGLGGYSILNTLLKIKNRTLKFSSIVLLISFWIVVPYLKGYSRTYMPKELDWKMPEYNIAYVLRDIQHNKTNFDSFSLVFTGYEGMLKWYEIKLKEQNRKVELVNLKHDFPKTNDKIMIYKQNVKDSISKYFVADTLFTYREVLYLRLINKRPL